MERHNPRAISNHFATSQDLSSEVERQRGGRRRLPRHRHQPLQPLIPGAIIAPSAVYSGTIPIQNIVLSPTSISYLRTKVSLPSPPMRNTDRPARIVFTASPSLTFTGRLCS